MQCHMAIGKSHCISKTAMSNCYANVFSTVVTAWRQDERHLYSFFLDYKVAFSITTMPHQYKMSSYVFLVVTSNLTYFYLAVMR
jgi:hypothetical protein